MGNRDVGFESVSKYFKANCIMAGEGEAAK